MRIVRLLSVLLVVGSTLGWGFSLPIVSGAGLAAPRAAPAAPAASFTINVATPADVDPTAGPGPCSLRGALSLLYAVDNGACGTVVPPAGSNVTIVLPPMVQLSLPDILPAVYNGDVVNITGPLVIDGGSQNGRHDGIFQIVDGTLNLKGLTLQHGSRSGGGAIWLRSGTFTADSVTFDSNDAAADPVLNGTGGAIEVDFGAITVTKSIFTNNWAYDAGGAVSTDFGYFSQDQFLNNKAAAGGAFEVDSPTTNPVVVIDSKFYQNLARPQKPSEFPANGYTTHGDSNGGGAIQNNGNLLLARDSIRFNRTELNKGGGGFSNEAAATAQVIDSVFTDNQVAAQGGGPTNTFIDFAWGGGIYNAGDLSLVRVSMFANQADYAGAVMNHLPGNLKVYNSTITNNNAKYLYGGLVNEDTHFDPTASPGGAQIHLYHATIGKNTSSSQADADNVLPAMFDHTVWFANSILAAGCTLTQYTVSRSIMTGACVTEPDPSLDLFAGPDISMTSQIQLGLQSMQIRPAPVEQFASQAIDPLSIAATGGRDDVLGCGDPLINHQDQNLAPRPTNACSSGAFQAAAAPAHFDSNPAPGLNHQPGIIQFPVINFSQGHGGSLANLTLYNTGGGALTFQFEFLHGSSYIFLEPGQPTQGVLLQGKSATFTFACQPQETGFFFADLTIGTDAPNRPQADYLLHCLAEGTQQLADPDTEPGPDTLPQPQLGGTAALTKSITNAGPQPLSVQAGLTQPGGPISLSPAVAQAPSGPAAIVPPGQTASFKVTCAPVNPGVFVNTLVFTTNDPVNPIIQYNLSCEGQIPSPPEPLSTASAYNPNPAAHVYGVAVSPDGAQVLGGGGQSETTLSAFVRDPSTGALTQNGWVALPGMSAIQSIKYSHDGQYVYYTSAEGNGIVAINSAGDSLGSSQVITSGTTYICGFQNLHFVFCPIGTMHGADGLAVSPDDQYVYVVGYYDDSLTAFQRGADGQLSFFQALTSTVNGLSGPVRVTTSPDGQNVYVASFNSSTVAVFGRDATGRLNFLQAYTNGAGGLTNLGGPADLAMSPDGNFLYVSASSSGAVDVFQRSSADGGLSLSSVITGVTGVWGLAIAHDDAGRRLFLTTQNTTNQVQVYGRDQTTGALSFVGANTVTDPVFVTASPDDQDVYASLYSANALQHFQTVRNAPVLTHLSPASAVAGGSAFTLTAVGGRFYPNSQIVWAGAPLATVFVSEHELQASVAAGLISAQQNPNVVVRNAAPGGGDSSPLAFAVTGPAQPPVPSIESLDPPAASFGGGDLVVLVHGANFAPNAAVSYNGAAVPTLFLNANLLQITLSADILSTPGDGGLVVTNGGAMALSAPAAPGTAQGSTPFSFSVNPPGVPAAPALTRLAPSSAVSGSAGIWVKVTGYNFSTGAPAQSVGRWNGLARPTVVLDAHTLMMGLAPADLAVAGYGQITVQTPGYGTSTPLAFRVRLPNEKPVPVVTGATLQGRTLAVFGSDFDPAAQISLNGVMRTTTFVNPYEVTTPMTAAARAVIVKVTNPAPGGGTSNAVIVVLNYLFLPLVRR